MLSTSIASAGGLRLAKFVLLVSRFPRCTLYLIMSLLRHDGILWSTITYRQQRVGVSEVWSLEFVTGLVTGFLLQVWPRELVFLLFLLGANIKESGALNHHNISFGHLFINGTSLDTCFALSSYYQHHLTMLMICGYVSCWLLLISKNDLSTTVPFLFSLLLSILRNTILHIYIL